jgi:O-antigen ligase
MRGQISQLDQPARMGVMGWLIAALILLLIGRLAEYFPGIQSLPMVKIVSLLLLLALLFARPAGTDFRGLHTPLSRNALALLLLAMLSMSFSIWKSQTFMFMKNELPVLILLFVAVTRGASSHYIGRRVLTAFAFCGVMLAAFAALSYGGGRASVESWYDTNDLAYVLVTLLPAYVALRQLSAGLWRWFWLAQCVLATVVVALTGSRGGMIALALVGLWYVFVGAQAVPKKNRGSALLKSMALAVVLVVAAAASWPFLPAETRERLQSITDLGSDYNLQAGNRDSRTDIWKRALTQLAGRPIGFGLNAFPAVDGRTGGIYHTAHNSVVLVSVELGVLGGILYLRMYWLAWRQLGRRMRGESARNVSGEAASSDNATAESAEGALIAGNLRVSLVANFVAGFFLSQCYSFLIWGLFAFISGFAPQLKAPQAVRGRRGRAPVSRPATARDVRPLAGRQRLR